MKLSIGAERLGNLGVSLGKLLLSLINDKVVCLFLGHIILKLGFVLLPVFLPVSDSSFEGILGSS